LRKRSFASAIVSGGICTSSGSGSQEPRDSAAAAYLWAFCQLEV
jgi:hypothetical protein